jgi:hypothetical protein
MKNQPNPRKSNLSKGRDNRGSLPSMATPRHPEPLPKMGLLGFILILGILAGLVWLVMLIFGLGPYKGGMPVPTSTPTFMQISENTGTPSLVMTGTATPSLIPSLTLTPTFTPTFTPEPTSKPMPFKLKGEPEALNSELIRPELSCDWLIIAGQVWDLQEVPVTDLTLHLFGELGGYTIDMITMSGYATVYGESGYEFTLQDLVVDSEGTLFIQLVDNNGIPLSDPYPIQTFKDCQKNLILVNFHQVQ